ncbi:hypothetical protein BpHYR1_029397 [Brachionus plicatilis]|uniref:Uncharacterized protein n=1 Tax=Brachionus plicatilis TaxID=10195 RepID=A0A3M7PRT3_BRAPC|nr:hypothetical protein BpHYR1_029397 [Brachionus plicatilis]
MINLLLFDEGTIKSNIVSDDNSFTLFALIFFLTFQSRSLHHEYQALEDKAVAITGMFWYLTKHSTSRTSASSSGYSTWLVFPVTGSYLNKIFIFISNFCTITWSIRARI